MKISPVSQSINNNRKNTSFKINRRTVLDQYGRTKYKTTTYFFRSLDWEGFVNYLKYNYVNATKVNFIDHACSNGPEAYSIAMKLITKLGTQAEKFFPIIAKDVDKNNILMAQQNFPIEIDNQDIYAINRETQNRFGDFFTPIKSLSLDYELAVLPKKSLREKIEFSLGDVFKDIEEAPKSNTVFFCRNFWPYLSEKEQKNLAKKLRHFDETSIIAIGEYDATDSNVQKLLKKNGFLPTTINYIFKKK